MDLIFRDYQPTDHAELVEMVMGLYTKDGSKPTLMTPQKIGLTIEQLSFSSNLCTIIIIDAGSSIIGYCILNRFWSNEFSGFVGYVDELFIKPNYRGKGIGEKFFEHIERDSRFSFAALMLEVVESNSKAAQFYKRIGFGNHHNNLLFKQLVAI